MNTPTNSYRSTSKRWIKNPAGGYQISCSWSVFERVQADGTIEHTYGVYEGENQSPWATHGLVANGIEHLERTE